MYTTETTKFNQSNWVKIQNQIINSNQVVGFYIDKKSLVLKTTFVADCLEIFRFNTCEEAQAEYDRLKKILIGE